MLCKWLGELNTSERKREVQCL